MAGGTADNCNIVGQGNIFVSNHGHQGCASQASLGIRIKQLNEVFKETHTLHKAEELLERHNHVAICGAPGEGKTCTALKICEKYLHKKHEVVFVENIEVFDVDTIIQRTCDMLVVFDDIFGSVAFPSSSEKIHKVLIALVDGLVNTSFQQEQAAQKKRDWKNKQDKTQADEKPKSPHKLLLIFTSRSYNWNEGRGRMHQFKVNLFKPESVIDMTKTGLTIEEKESIMNLFEKRSKKCNISNEDKNTITRLQDSMFGFPLICQLYCTNPAFQMHNIIDFFQKPVTYLRGDLDTIVREGSSRSAALVLLVLCGGKLNLASFKGKEKSLTDLFQAVKEDIVSCTRTDIGREISNFTGTYCTVENHVACFSHPSIYDAAACALGNLNEDLLLEHCSLQFLYERVRLNKADHQQTTHTDDVTNMIYITSSLHPLVISRLMEGVREGCFRWTVSHPVFSCVQIASDFLTQMTADLPTVLHRKDKSSGECFLYWVSLSTNHSLFKHSVSLMCREGSLSHSVLADFYDSIIGCTEHGNLRHLQHIAAVLKQRGEYDVDRRTKGEKTLLMIAAEAGQLGVFNFLLQEVADVSVTDEDRYNCLHLSCKSGSKDIVNVIIEKFQHLINDRDSTGNTPAMVCAESGQGEILKFLVSHKADLTLQNVFNVNAFQIASSNGHVSVVEYLLTCEHITIDMRGGWGHQTAVMMAAEGGQYDVYNLLVLEGADLLLTDGNNCDCLMLACVGGNVSIVKHLLSLKTLNINRRMRSQKQTAVMMAAERGQYDVYNLLVLEGADLSLTDIFNRDCLMLACEGGNVFIVKHLLSLKTFDINRRAGLWNQTAVMMAAERGQYDVYYLLVLEGADLSFTDRDNMDCLMLACKGGNVAILKHLLSLKTIDINRRAGLRNQTSVMMAAERGQYDVYNLLVLEGADLSLTDEDNMDCLMLACEGGNVFIVKHLLSLKTFDINRRMGLWEQAAIMMAVERTHYDEDNRDCLILACEGGNVSIVKHLLSLKAFDINRRVWLQKQTAVMLAAERGHYDVYNLLVLEGADLSLTDEDNRDCLMLACKRGNVLIVKHLLSLKTFDINRRWGSRKQTAVMMAAERGQYDVYNLLVLEGADLSLTDEDNRDCLMLACKSGNVYIVKHLLSLKTFDINRRWGALKQTVVMVAAARGQYDVYHLLVLEGADLSLSDEDNMDCLMLACKGGNVSIVKHLLSLKTFDINRRWGSQKQTAVMMAAEGGQYDVYNLLVLEGADLSLTDEDNRDCLMLACKRGNVYIVKHLLSLKTFDINKRWGALKQTAIMMAAERGQYDVYNLLVFEGADLSLTDGDSMDCLMLACKGGNVTIVKHLLSLNTFDMSRREGHRRLEEYVTVAKRNYYCEEIVNLLRYSLE
ncbi:serine/threonine-protein phosphatase 6 regulatory ankyrin repeat subunit C-like isoform X2 [Haliotis rufescens]|nr:serine/threonine-protein phosphatase 6 regulatory ankyrin repeat subunit C-like isoform X2 [Haliotis rufescens]